MKRMAKNKLKSQAEPVEEKAPKKNRKVSRSVATVLSGEFLSGETVVNNLGYLLFLVFLALVYIGNGYRAQALVREIDKVEKEVKELRSEYITTSSELMYTTKQSELVKIINAKGLGLEESVVPPGKIEITESEYEALKAE